MSTKKLPVLTLPAIVVVADYHELDTIAAAVNIVCKGGRVRVDEIGFNGRYVGLVYPEGSKPDETVINGLLREKGITLVLGAG